MARLEIWDKIKHVFDDVIFIVLSFITTRWRLLQTVVKIHHKQMMTWGRQKAIQNFKIFSES